MSLVEFEQKISKGDKLTLQDLRVKRISSSVLALRRAQTEPDIEIQQSTYEHVYNQETTHLSEILDGIVKTEVDFTSVGGKLYALDETGPIDWEDFHKNNWNYANLLTQNDQELKPYLKIAELEADEGYLQAKMVEVGEPKTMAVLSLCGDDILSQKALTKLGRNPTKQRAMFRVSIFDGQDLKIYSRSIDSMDLKAGQEFLRINFGIELSSGANSTDILKTRIILDGAHHNLADDLTPPQAGVDTFKFVLAQSDLLAIYYDSLEKLAKTNLNNNELAHMSNELRYDIMASFKDRLTGHRVYATVDSITSSGDKARQEGIEFGGCDMVVSSSINKFGYGVKGEVSRECITCPGCSKVVNADKKHFDAGFLKCPECKLTVQYRANAKLPDQSEKTNNQNKEGFFEWWTRKKQQDKLKRQHERLAQKEQQKVKKLI